MYIIFYCTGVFYLYLLKIIYMRDNKALTRNEIQKELGISRTKFVTDVQPNLVQIPSLTICNLYSYDSFEVFKKRFKKQKPGRKKLENVK